MTLQKGTLLGPYEIGAPIGAGGMGEVYRARDTRLGRTVAVKILPAEYAQDAKFRVRFEREAKAISALNHPHICTLYDVGDSFLVMEYCEGTTLAARTAAGPLPLAETLEYGMQIADALANAHRGGIVHRDLKPGNIMLTPSGVKLLDFGLAKKEPAMGSIESTVERLTEDGRIVGTIQYMAPEVLGGREASAASDVFALGLVLYEMATGRAAFGGASRAGVIAAILEREPVAITEIAPKTPPALERLIGECLAKDPNARTLTAEDVGRRLRWIREHPGRPRLRKVALAAGAVAAAALLAIGGRSAWTRFQAAAVPSIESLAVLPLENLSGPDQEYFAAGMHDAMIGQLAQIRALRLISRTSAMHYKDTTKSVPEIARELNVDAIVEGSVIRLGDAVRIQVRLIRAHPEERQIWAHTFDRDFKNVLALQSDVARAIAETIEVRLTPQETTRLAGTRAVNPATYDTYLKAMYYVNKLDPEDVEKGIAYLNEAMREDPRDPFAYAALALAYATGAHGPMPAGEAFDRAKTLASTALQLDDTSAEAHLALGMVHAYYEFDWPGAEREFRRTLELNPNLALAHRGYGFHRQLEGNADEGIAELTRAKELDPLSPLYRAELGWHYWCAGNLRKAYEEGRSAVEIDPDFRMGQGFLSASAADLGRHEEAIAAANKGFKYSLAYAYARAGRKDEARALAAQLAQNPRPIYGWGLAEVYVALGDNEEALRWLEYGVKERFSWMPWIRRNPALEPLRGNPEFERLADSMNAPR